MGANLVAEETLNVGQEAVLEGPSPEGRYVAVFEDDGDTGYCRTGFPPPDPKWTKHTHAWDDAALNLFK